jgi:hypothetical protein
VLGHAKGAFHRESLLQGKRVNLPVEGPHGATGPLTRENAAPVT